jgi:periplasmic protein CpxP/Spy
MKTLVKLSLLALGLAVAAVPALTAAPDKGKLGDRPMLKALVQRRAALKARVAKRLELTDDQKAQLKAKRGETRTALKALRDDTSLTREQKKEKARELLQGTRSEMRSHLTPDQTAKLDKARERLGKIRKQRNK